MHMSPEQTHNILLDNAVWKMLRVILNIYSAVEHKANDYRE